MVKGAPEPTNVNQANAKQVTSPASVSPVEDAVVVKYVNLGLSNDMRGGYDKLCGVVRSLGEILMMVQPTSLRPKIRR